MYASFMFAYNIATLQCNMRSTFYYSLLTPVSPIGLSEKQGPQRRRYKRQPLARNWFAFTYRLLFSCYFSNKFDKNYDYKYQLLVGYYATQFLQSDYIVPSLKSTFGDDPMIKKIKRQFFLWLEEKQLQRIIKLQTPNELVKKRIPMHR